MRHAKTRLAASLLLASISVLGLAACVPEQPPLMIGYLGPLSGRSSDLGIAGRDGALLAVEQRNERGGISGRKLSLLVADTSLSPKAAFAQVSDAGALCIIGPMVSTVAVEVAPLATERGIALVSPTVSTDALTDMKDNFFRVYPSNSSAADELARVVKETFGLESVAIIYDESNKAHTGTWKDNFTRDFEKRGGTVSVTRGFKSGDVSGYPEIVEHVLRQNPPCVLLLSNALDSALLSTQLRERGFIGRVVASEWSATEALVGYGGMAVEGLSFLSTIDHGQANSARTAFIERFKARFGYEGGFASVHAYEAVQLVLAAIEENPTRRGVETVLKRGGTFEAVGGRLRLDSSGDVVRPYFLTSVHNGVFSPRE